MKGETIPVTIVALANGKGSVHYSSNHTGKHYIIDTNVDFRDLRDCLVELQREAVIETMKAGIEAVPDMLKEKHIIHLDAKPPARAAAAIAK